MYTCITICVRKGEREIDGEGERGREGERERKREIERERESDREFVSIGATSVGVLLSCTLSDSPLSDITSSLHDDDL